MTGLTPKQLACLEFLEEFIGANSVAPSYEQIRDRFGFASKSAVVRLIDRLEQRGHIRRKPRLARSLELIKHTGHIVCCPNCKTEFEPGSAQAKRGTTLGGDLDPHRLAAEGSNNSGQT